MLTNHAQTMLTCARIARRAANLCRRLGNTKGSAQWRQRAHQHLQSARRFSGKPARP